jgi:methylmalonyl-CoA/ethylmalonyl-CoA epimerase
VLTVSVRFLLDRSGVVFELIAPFGSPSVVDTVLKKGASIINQVAYRTDDLAAAGQELATQGCMPIGEAKPARAFGGALVQFYLSRLGFIIELIESAAHQHDFKPITLS